jgi:hypothetical protein
VIGIHGGVVFRHRIDHAAGNLGACRVVEVNRQHAAFDRAVEGGNWLLRAGTSIVINFS